MGYCENRCIWGENVFPEIQSRDQFVRCNYTNPENDRVRIPSGVDQRTVDASKRCIAGENGQGDRCCFEFVDNAEVVVYQR